MKWPFVTHRKHNRAIGEAWQLLQDGENLLNEAKRMILCRNERIAKLLRQLAEIEARDRRRAGNMP